MEETIQAAEKREPLKDTKIQTKFNKEFNPYYFLNHPDEAQVMEYVSDTERFINPGNRAHLALPIDHSKLDTGRVDYPKKLESNNRLANVLINPEFSSMYNGGLRIESNLNEDGLEISIFYINFEVNNSKYLAPAQRAELIKGRSPQDQGRFSPILMGSSYFRLCVPMSDIDIKINDPEYKVDNYYLERFDWTELGYALANSGNTLNNYETRNLTVREAERFVEAFSQSNAFLYIT